MKYLEALTNTVPAQLLTVNVGLAACLSVIATIATDRLTRIAYASVKPKNSKNACK